MPLGSTKRAVVAALILLAITAGGAAVYLHRLLRPLPGPRQGTAPDLLSLLPQDAPVVAYVDVTALRALEGSPLANALGFGASSPPLANDRDYAEFVRNTGFDYARDLDRVALAIWPPTAVPKRGVIPPPKILAFADGRFDEQKISAYALRTGRKIEIGQRKAFEIPSDPQTGKTTLAFLAPGQIAIASGRGLEDVLTAKTSPAPRDFALNAEIERVAGAPIFAVVRTDNLPNNFYANFANSPQLEKLLRNIRSLSLTGLPTSERLKIVLDAECDSPKNAFELSTLLEGFRLIGSAALADPRSRRQITREEAALLENLLSEVQMKQQDRYVRLRLDVTPAMLMPPTDSPARRTRRIFPVAPGG